jgi:predicted P-loop ATPase
LICGKDAPHAKGNRGKRLTDGANSIRFAGASRMSAAGMFAFGDRLTPEDYARLAARWIPAAMADLAGIRRVTSLVGQQMFGRKRGDCAGLILPNVPPWDAGHVREFRLRLDSPPLEQRADGSLRETGKYIQPPGRPNILYFPPGIATQMLEDVKLPVMIVEGEFKALAAFRLAKHNTAALRFLPVAVAGVYSFRGVIGKAAGPNGDRRDVKGTIPDVERIRLKGRPVLVAFDADAESNPSVRAARWRLSSALVERGAAVGFLEWPIEEGKGLDDWLATVGPEKVLATIGNVTFGDWRTRLLRADSGKLIACFDNAALMLENSVEWAGVLAYNEFTEGYFIRRPPPAPVTAIVGQEIEDTFDTEAIRWLERQGIFGKPDMIRRIVDLLARRNPFHPVLDYLRSLPPWDGTKRIATWLIDYCQVEHSEFAKAVGEKFLIAAVARVREPGAKVDNLLVLEGPQGIGKSSVPRILAGGDWFTDQLSEMGGKDCSMQLRGRWLIELSELDALNRVETARAKAFFSQQTERFRLPYGSRLVEIKRQCVFMGTTNADTWLKDETGNRRYWPVRCRGPIDLDALRRDRDQLWAEALAAYESGVKWWLDNPEAIAEAAEEQRGRFEDDPWQESVITYAEQEADDDCSVSITQILLRIGVELQNQDQAKRNRVARCLKSAGLERWHKRVGKNPEGKDLFEWRYRKLKPETG